MTETTVQEQTTVQNEQPTPVAVNPFDDSTWSETPVVEQKPPVVEEAKPQEPAPTEQAPTQPAVDYNAYVKEKFGYDSEETLAQELSKFKQEKVGTDFANEESKKLFEYIKQGKKEEVYNLLQKEMKLERLSTVPVDSPTVAAEIIKTSLQAKYSDLSDDEINRKFEKLFSVPEKPKQGFDETDDEYQEKLAVWERQKSDVEKDMMIEAKIVRKEIESLKSELKLPDIFGGESQEQGLSQEDLQKAEALRKAYESELDTAAKTFNGFNITAKSEDAELPVAFVPTESEKAQYREKLFDFDSEQYLEQRWLKQDGTVDAQKAMRDLYILENHEAILQKVANEAAAKMLEHIIKTRSNINLNSVDRQADPQFADDSFQKKQSDTIWAA